MTHPLILKLEIVSNLSSEDRQALEAICRTTRSLDRGRDIVREGDQPEQIYVLLEGWAARYKALPDGSRQITAFLIPGDFCDMEVTVLKHMDHSVTALTPVTIASIDRQALIRLTRERPELAQAFWWTTLVDEAVLRAWVVNLGSARRLHPDRSSSVRVARQDEGARPGERPGVRSAAHAGAA